MDDAVGAILILILGAFVIGIAVAIAIGIFVLGAAGGALVALVQGAVAFGASLVASVRSRGAATRSPHGPEPAYQLYVLGQFKADLRAALEAGWETMQEAQQTSRDFAGRIGHDWLRPLSFGIVAGGFVAPLLGGLLGMIVVAPLLVVAGLLIAGAWLLVGLLRIAEALRQKIRRSAYECPEDHQRFALPIYICPGCNAKHSRLVPGRWGIFKRECQCEKVALPTMVLNGRQEVPQTCPSGHPMSGLIGYAQTLRIALVAGPSAGKTTYLAAAMRQLEKLGDEKRLAVEVLKESRASYQAMVDGLEYGRVPEKTQVVGNPALIAEVQGKKRSQVMHAYDVAGEHYGDTSGVARLQFLEVPSGIVMLIDPLAITRIAEERHEEIESAKDALAPSQEDPIRAVERTISALVEGGADPKKIPVAVTIAKADALGIDAEIKKLEQSAGADAPRAWLEQQGAGNLVRAIDNEFDRVGWFACSALGRLPQSGEQSPFEPRGALEPMLWLLAQNDIVPSEAPFEPDRQAEQLSGADATHFPPIGAGGWAWRAGASATAVSAILAAAVFGLVQTVDIDPGGSGAAALASGGEQGGQGSGGGKGSGGSGGAKKGARGATPPDGESARFADRVERGYPPESDATMRADIRALMLEFHRAVVDRRFRDAWNLLTDRKRAQKQAEEGYEAWAQAQATLSDYLDPSGISINIEKREGYGVARIMVTGMRWTKPGSPCSEWSGLTWVRYEEGEWRYDPGYSTSESRERDWKPRLSELMGVGC